MALINSMSIVALEDITIRKSSRVKGQEIGDPQKNKLTKTINRIGWLRGKDIFARKYI